MATRTAAKTKVAVKPDVKPSVGPSTSVRGATGSSSRSNGGRPSSLQATKETANMADFYLGQTSNAVELSSDESDFGNEIQADIEEEKDYKAKRQQGTGRGRGRRPEFRSRVVKVEDGKQKADSEAERTKKAKQWKKKPNRAAEVMSRSVHSQQVKVNPLLKILRISITIVPSSDEGSSEDEGSEADSGDSFGSDGEDLRGSKKLKARKRVGQKKRKKAKEVKKTQVVKREAQDSVTESETQDSEAEGMTPLHTAKQKGKGRASSTSDFSDRKPDIKPDVSVALERDAKPGLHPDVKPDIKPNVRPVSGADSVLPDDYDIDEDDLSDGAYERKRARETEAKRQLVEKQAQEEADAMARAEVCTGDEEGDEDEEEDVFKGPIDVVQSGYPRTQKEERPHFDISTSEQDAIGPLLLAKPNTVSLNTQAGGRDRSGFPVSFAEDPARRNRPVAVPQGINRYLREYQREGIRFFYEHYARGEGGILGDDMGLGKTIQVIGFLSAIMQKTGTKADKGLRNKRVKKAVDSPSSPTAYGPTCLIIAPTSVVGNWEREFETWSYIEAKVMTSDNKTNVLKRFRDGAYDAVVVGIEFARRNIEELKDLDFTCIIIDEVHRIKNPTSQAAKAFRLFKSNIRFGLTGTALQNNYQEMHTVLDWARPGELGTRAMWHAFVTEPLLAAQKLQASHDELAKGRARAIALRDHCLPMFFLRRTKDLIKDQLPRKTDRIVFCPLTKTQVTAYRNLLNSEDVQTILRNEEPCDCGREVEPGQALRALWVDDAADSGGRIPYARGRCCYQGWYKMILQYMTVFTKVANHLVLLYPRKEDRVGGQAQQVKHAQDVNYLRLAFPDDWAERNYTKLAEWEEELCGKWKVLDEMLKKFKAEGDKVLVFSRSVKLLDCLASFCEFNYPEFCRLDGSVAADERLRIVDEFQNDPDKFIFLVSTLAGGVGLNLTAANRVVVFDPNWNPSHDLQALDRAFRIGQIRDVDCYRLVSGGSLEELIYTRQVYKSQSADVMYNATHASRYFEGVMGDKSQRGELFGVKNIFKLQNEASMSEQVITRCNISEVAFALGKMMSEKDAGKTGKRRRVSDDADSDVEDVVADFNDEARTSATPQAHQTLLDLIHGEKPRVASEARDPIMGILQGLGVNYSHKHEDLMMEAAAEKARGAQAMMGAKSEHNRQPTKRKRDEPIPLWPPARATAADGKKKAKLLPELIKVAAQAELDERTAAKEDIRRALQSSAGDRLASDEALMKIADLFGMSLQKFASDFRQMTKAEQRELHVELMKKL